jgi:hypothetical protein
MPDDPVLHPAKRGESENALKRRERVARLVEEWGIWADKHPSPMTEPCPEANRAHAKRGRSSDRPLVSERSFRYEALLWLPLR